MGRCKITAINDDIDGSTMLNVRINNKRLFIARSSIDKALPEMYNYDGEQLFFVEVPYDALIVDGIERASGKARTVMTLAKIEQSIAAGGKSYKINPAYGVETSQIESYSFTTKGGEVMTVTPQEGQYRFYSNRGITKILGILEQTGNLLDIVSILNFGMNSDKRTAAYTRTSGSIESTDETVFRRDRRNFGTCCERAIEEGEERGN